MPREKFSFSIQDVVDLLGLERNPRSPAGARSYYVRCPLCGDKSYNMNINLDKDAYRCFRCSDDKGTGALDLYGRVRFGTPLVPGRNGNGHELFESLCKELNAPLDPKERPRQREVYVHEIHPASDDKLDKAYRALFSLPYLRLNRFHASELMKRGFQEDAIRLHGYGSMPSGKKIMKRHPCAEEVSKWYRDNKIEDVRKNDPILQRFRPEDIMAGFLIATDICKAGVEPVHVPGFFTLCGRWCFHAEAGIMIPTINFYGQYVCMQIRRDVKSPKGIRYMTVSSKGLPQGPTTDIARTHFIYTGQITPHTQVLFTEGPLKADVIHYLLYRFGVVDTAVVAIHGVNNTKELPKVVDQLAMCGVTVAQSALDMDKTGNLQVAKNGRNIREIFAKGGIELQTLCWDEPYACKKLFELEELCWKNNLPFPEDPDNPYFGIYECAKTLSEHNIPYNYAVDKNGNIQKTKDGKEIKVSWRPETKGYDDFLWNLLKKQQKEGAV